MLFRSKGGWAIPTTVAKKKEEAKPVLMANGVEKTNEIRIGFDDETE